MIRPPGLPRRWWAAPQRRTTGVKVSCWVIASARVSAGPGANTRISGHGAWRGVGRRDAQRPQRLIGEFDAVTHALIGDPPHRLAAVGRGAALVVITRLVGVFTDVGLVGLHRVRVANVLDQMDQPLVVADGNRQALSATTR